MRSSQNVSTLRNKEEPIFLCKVHIHRLYSEIGPFFWNFVAFSVHMKVQYFYFFPRMVSFSIKWDDKKMSNSNNESVIIRGQFHSKIFWGLTRKWVCILYIFCVEAAAIVQMHPSTSPFLCNLMLLGNQRTKVEINKIKRLSKPHFIRNWPF